jgi:hypothetical protein
MLKVLIVLHCGGVTYYDREDLSFAQRNWDEDIAEVYFQLRMGYLMEKHDLCMDDITGYYFEYYLDDKYFCNIVDYKM